MTENTEHKFDENLFEARLSKHLNGGRDFNYCIYQIFYLGEEIATWKRGRIDKKGAQVSEVLFEGNVFQMPQQRTELVDSIKDFFIKRGTAK